MKLSNLNISGYRKEKYKVQTRKKVKFLTTWSFFEINVIGRKNITCIIKFWKSSETSFWSQKISRIVKVTQLVQKRKKKVPTPEQSIGAICFSLRFIRSSSSILFFFDNSYSNFFELYSCINIIFKIEK